MPRCLHLRRALGLLVATLACLPPLASGEPAPALTLAEIVQRAVARDDALRATRLGMKCDQTVRTRRLDPEGKVLSEKTEKTVHFQSKGIVYRTDASASGGSGEEVARKESAHVEAVMNLGKLAGRFQMALVGEATVGGRGCHVIRYWPKGGQASETREEKVLDNLKGRFWIAKDDFSILQSEGALSSPVTVALIASVTRMDFQFSSLTLPNGDIAPGSFSVNIAVKAPFYDFRELKTTTQENWRR